MLPLPSLVALSGARADAAFAGAFVRSSSRSLSGLVAVAVFRSPVVAGAFSRTWGARVPALCWGCTVVSIAPGLWGVSVPCAVAAAPGRRAAVFSAAWSLFRSGVLATCGGCLRAAWAGALFVLARNAAVFDSEGFGAKLARVPITGLTLHDTTIYGPDAAAGHRGDLARIAVFRSG